MFPIFHALKRNVPNVEDHILEMLGQRDLVMAKEVNRVWATAVRSYMKRLDRGMLELLLCLKEYKALQWWLHILKICLETHYIKVKIFTLIG